MRFLVLSIWLVSFQVASVEAADTAKVTYAGGDGSSMEKAILIVGAKDDLSATHSEYVYLARISPGYMLKGQSLLNQSGKAYDQLDFVDRSGSPHRIYFDITATFGKL